MSFLFRVVKSAAKVRGQKYFIYMGKSYPTFTVDEILDIERKVMKESQSEIDDILIANMIQDFNSEFKTLYPNCVHTALGAVGPMQSFIGLAIKNGYIRVNNDMDDM